MMLPPAWRKKDVSKDVVLITGSGSGIGRLMAVKFAKLGSVVVLWDINNDDNEETARLVRNAGGHAYTYTCDIGDRETVYKTAERVKQQVGDVTILINNAGIVTGKTILEAPDDMIEKTFQVNALAHFWTVKAFLPGMVQKTRGHIVTVASMAGIFGTNKIVDYSASKFAAVGFDESLRLELSTTGMSYINTTCVCPYIISTGMFAGAKFRYRPPMEPDYAAQRIVDAVLANELFVTIPGELKAAIFLKRVLPVKTQFYLQKITGVDSFMATFAGRHANAS
jgi:all-trans-retinol dehydrogenase (NAD+)